MNRTVSRMDAVMLRAAESGDRLAQINLAVMHDNRRRMSAPAGLSHDAVAAALHDEEALKWWARAAGQGSAKAQASLALRYESGDGVKQDLVEALMWTLLAEPQLRGDDGERAKDARRRLSRRMTPADVRRAERRAGLWKAEVEGPAKAAS